MSEIQFVPLHVFEALRSADLEPLARTRLFATLARINTLSMIAFAGSGHVGSSFSSMDIFSWLYLNVLRRPNTRGEGARDVFFSSKGHDAPGLYSVMIGCGLLPYDNVCKLRRLDGLPGHPDVSTALIATNTGSLGMGISKARGMAIADRLRGREGHFYVMTGDGELQEGQIWESLSPTVNNGVNNITVVVDHNKLQSDTLVERVSDLGDLEAKFAAFGWYVDRCDGNDFEALAAAFARAAEIHDRPKVIIADTLKGSGVSFMQPGALDDDTLYGFHSGAPSDEDYRRALDELVTSADGQLAAAGLPSLELEGRARPPKAVPKNPQRLIGAYAEALLTHGRAHSELVVLDADLMLDCGLIPFRKAFPERFVECGIAEQDMVSQAGGMALEGLLPVVHSFACFLSTRPNEHIYNNATERRKVIYAGSLAGLLPSGPGHSHQSVRDISALTGVPGLTLFQPSCEREVGMALDWAVNENPQSAYLRLVSIPVEIPFELPFDYHLVPGQGVVLRDGADAVLFAYGPVMLAQAWKAAEELKESLGLDLRVVNQPWLNRIDGEWLAAMVDGRPVFTLDDHYVDGGMGTMLAAQLAVNGGGGPMVRLGMSDVPACGTNDEVLRHHGLDAQGIAASVLAAIG